MITIITKETEEVSQVFYDETIDDVSIYSLTCSCGQSGCLIGHGRYIRHVKTGAGKTDLSIRRVCCTVCGATHALLISALVPYSQVTLQDHATIAASYESGGSGMEVLDNNPELSPSQVWYILSQYIHVWRQRILSEHINLYPLHILTQSCITIFSRQFMQIKVARNILFSAPT